MNGARSFHAESRAGRARRRNDGRWKICVFCVVMKGCVRFLGRPRLPDPAEWHWRRRARGLWPGKHGQLNALSNSKTFSFGPLTDISFYVGADGNTKNTAFAPRKRNVVAGLQFEFGLAGGGFLNVAPVFYQE
jgi:hypothetical protein